MTAMVVSVTVVMLLGAGIHLAEQELTASSRTGQEAEAAAQSGVAYVQARLAENYLWRGNGNAVIVNTPELWVREDHGNIVGLVHNRNGEISEFRVRFNGQDDGVGNGDGLPNPSVLSILMPYVSVQNLSGGSPRSVIRGTGSYHAVDPATPSNYKVPAGSACVIVQGLAGPRLQSCSPTNPQPSTLNGLSERVLEVYLRATAGGGGDAAVMAADAIKVALGTSGGLTRVTSAQASVVPQIRTKNTITVTGGAATNYVSPQGRTRAGDGMLHAQYSNTQVTPQQETNAGFYSLTWANVKKANSSDSVLPGGVYVLWDDNSLHYYNKNYATYVTDIQANPADAGTLVTNLPPGVQLSNNGKLTISRNLYIDPTAATTGEFTYIPRKGAREDPPSANQAASYNSNYVNALGATSQVGATAGWTGGPQAASWTVPLSSPLSSPSLQASTGNWQHGTFWGMRLVDNNNGTAQLQIDSGFQALTTPSISRNPQQALAWAMQTMNHSQNPQFAQIYSALLGAGGNTMNELNLGTLSPTRRSDDLEVEFKPPEGGAAILSADGDVRIGSRVTGVGGSITSAGQIRIVGAGSNLTASMKEGLNLYAKGDIVLSSLRQTGNDQFQYKDFKMKGVIYTWKNFQAKIGFAGPGVSNWGKFELEGAVVAYGGDPAGNPGNQGGGLFTIDAKTVDIAFDQAYLTQLNSTPTPGPLTRTLSHFF
ncbi:hypothetical protein ABS71_00700 [bacterium SCN 62-11]|nr:MAG: hypothetical protein ABS71_00700 [bacterium SCN 62-11]